MALGRSTAITDPGRRRRRNEDAFVCEPPLFAVADGMGGAQAGEIASRLAAGALRGPTAGEGSPGQERVVTLIQEANRRIFERASEDEAAAGMGTTLTVALAGEDVVTIGHVGDSRAYRVRDRALEQLTEDHSLVAELVRSGRLSPEEAESHPQRSVITRALGTDPEVEVDAFSVPARAGDLFMLCSDGLTAMVDDAAILGVVERHRDDLQAAARELVGKANRGGGEDNITIVLFEIAGGAEDTAGPATAAEPAPGPDEEKTLTELDRVPAYGAPEEAKPAPAPRGRRRLLRPVVLVPALVVIGAAAAAALLGLSRAHFVGAQPNGHVAVYQGVPWDLVGDVRLYRVVYESPLLAAQLSRAERRKLFDHDLVSKSAALRAVEQFERDVVP